MKTRQVPWWIGSMGALCCVALMAQERTVARPVVQMPPASIALERLEDVPIRVDTVRGTTMRPRSGTTPARYDLPLLADDLEPGERYYVGKRIHSDSGSQQWGYDVGLMKNMVGGDQWSSVKPGTDWSNIRNSDYYVFGKPVYAMGPGRVIRCWRNAPENPRPFSEQMGDDSKQAFEDRSWLHARWRERRMPGGGNHLLVEEDDGNLVLYAHAQPGSIPAALCPHNATVYTRANADAESDVPEAQQARIAAGQRLFLIGNTGNSTAPHLHVHKQTASGSPVQMQFNRGLANPIPDRRTADINRWTRFAGQRIPDGPVLVWPPRRLGGEYARHGLPAGQYQRLFDHLSDSGFWPEWTDGYSVGGQPFLNVVWRPAQGQWRSFFLLNAGDYQKAFNEATAAGLGPVQVDSATVGGQPRYSATFAANAGGGAIARHGLTVAQHDALLEEARSKNLVPVNVSVVSIGGQRSYTVLYRAVDVGRWELRSQIPESEYQAMYTAQGQAGRRPAYVNAYMHGGQPFLSAIFTERPDGKRRDRHGMSAQQYQGEFQGATQSGLKTRAVSAFDGAQSNHRFIGMWRE